MSSFRRTPVVFALSLGIENGKACQGMLRGVDPQPHSRLCHLCRACEQQWPTSVVDFSLRTKTATRTRGAVPTEVVCRLVEDEDVRNARP